LEAFQSGFLTFSPFTVELSPLGFAVANLGGVGGRRYLLLKATEFLCQRGVVLLLPQIFKHIGW
jgi:hypothetical protein